MKHLKKFNEALNKRLDLQEYCGTYLAYLSDKGFYTYIDPGYQEYRLRLTKGYTTTRPFGWSEISDQFIPFLYMLNKDYDLDRATVILTQSNGNTDSFSVEDMLKDSFSYDFVNNSKVDNVRKELGFKVAKSYIRVTLKSILINNIKLRR